MVSSQAKSVQEYLEELPAEKRAVMEIVRAVVLRNLPSGYVETMNWGMISYEIPLEVFPDTYNGQPLSYAGLAAQKNYYALYLMNVYAEPRVEAQLREGFTLAGKKLDMGKSCVRFRKLEDLPLGVIAEVIAATPVNVYLEKYKSARSKP